ncbi:alternative ribosome rescue aminoacyl-tRNA hydrolase ArfB [Algoriphagus halophytocola]|uniref:Alternative ribosome rescue aminoacyl-tRNA hydrolase ArfB n=1 Tax=Algoriphagus halophytocola TaxID=2991499 RepID=A0ABY6MIN8_9BACT|nr:alternative ribosome rescue aminoacyl-tRNA hydrolase ArfB [Algoriphagus sp. TR-M5]UZD23663.1 alternative ribosome rescue aminoacyl-tRNA hydrolase ArfB [Algoriphagus sp. TR-M5]
MQKSIFQRISDQEFLHELQFQSSKSSGPGGQHVNKVETKIQLSFDVDNSAILTDSEKDLLRQKLGNRITDAGILQIQVQEKRSQLQNKQLAILKFEEMLRKAFAKRKPRKATKPSKGAIERRLKAKKNQSEKKASRSWKRD